MCFVGVISFIFANTKSFCFSCVFLFIEFNGSITQKVHVHFIDNQFFSPTNFEEGSKKSLSGNQFDIKI